MGGMLGEVGRAYRGEDLNLKHFIHDLEVGQSVSIDLHPQTSAMSRHRAILLGWEAGRVLLFEPHPDENPCHFREGDHCQIRLMRDGLIWGFYSKIRGNIQDSVGYILEVLWPERVSTIRLRRHERAEVNLPCMLYLGDGSQIRGQLNDLSAGGCRVQTSLQLKKGDLLGISFDMLGAARVDRIPIEVQNHFKIEDAPDEYGCSFLDMEESALCGIGAYVARIVAERRGHESQHRCVLLFSNNPDDAITLRKAIKDIPFCDVMVTTEFLETVYRLMHYAPLALVVQGNSQDLSPQETAAIVHEAPALRTLPVIAYGDHAPETASPGNIIFLEDLQEAAKYLRGMLMTDNALNCVYTENGGTGH